MELHTFILGVLQTNAYVLIEGDECWVVDPGLEAGELVEFLRGRGLAPSRILLTHGHADHIGGIDELREAFADAKVTCPAADVVMLTDAEANMSAPFGFPVSFNPADATIDPGDELALGSLTWRVLDTAGHTPGGVSFYCPDEGIVLTGDALFAGSIGRCDIPNASSRQLLDNIRKNLYTLPPETKVLPGHGPATSIAAEKQSNPFVKG